MLNSDNTYSIYIFAAPIQYKTADGYKIINNDIIGSSKDEYRYQNAGNEIQTFFFEKCEDGMYISREKDWLAFVPKEAASLSEGIRQEYVNMYGDVVEAIDYVRIMKEGENHAVVYYGLSKSGDVIETSRFKLVGDLENGEEQMDFCINLEGVEETEYPLILDVSFELYRNKMPDSSVYSKLNENMYLNNYAIIGNEKNKGYSWEYVRFRINHFLSIRSDTVLEATYNTRCLFTSDKNFTSSMVLINKIWASTQVTWKTRVILEGQQSYKERRKGVYDITDFVKLCVEDQENFTEMCGCVLQGESGYGIYASADNGCYIPYVHLKLSKKPRAFVARKNINP